MEHLVTASLLSAMTATAVGAVGQNLTAVFETLSQALTVVSFVGL